MVLHWFASAEKDVDVSNDDVLTMLPFVAIVVVGNRRSFSSSSRSTSNVEQRFNLSLVVVVLSTAHCCRLLHTLPPWGVSLLLLLCLLSLLKL
jgi:hypothetical protein